MRKNMQHPEGDGCRASGRPLYRAIADDLLAGIGQGIFPVGTLLPGEMDLIQRYQSSRHTVREALRVLEDMGIVLRQRGRGTLVLSPEAQPAFVQMVKSPQELFSYPADSAFRVVSHDSVMLVGALAQQLKASKGSQWTRISGPRMFESGMPVCWTDVYVLPEYATIARQLGGPNSRPVYETISKAFGEEVQKISIEIYASSFEEEPAKALGVEVGTPSLCLCRRYHGNKGRVFEISVSEHPAQNYSYSLEFTSGWQNAGHWSWNK
jgi:GntR family transcriptional regulator